MGFYSAASLVPGSFSNPSSKMHVYLIYLFLHTICFNSLVWLTSNATFWDSGLWVFFSLSFLWDWPLDHHRQGHNVENWIDPNDHDFPDLKALHSQDWKGSHCVSDTYPQQWPKCKYGYSWVHVGIQFANCNFKNKRLKIILTCITSKLLVTNQGNHRSVVFAVEDTCTALINFCMSFGTWWFLVFPCKCAKVDVLAREFIFSAS